MSLISDRENYLVNAQLKEFLAWEAASRDTIDVKRIYIDIAGDLVAGVLLSQIVFWFLPGRDGHSKLKVKREGKEWLVKKRTDWWDEIRIRPKQFDRAIKTLMKNGLVTTELHPFAGVRNRTFINLNLEMLALEVLCKIPQMGTVDVPGLFPKWESYHIDNIEYTTSPNPQRKGQRLRLRWVRLLSGETTQAFIIRTPK